MTTANCVLPNTSRITLLSTSSVYRIRARNSSPLLLLPLLFIMSTWHAQEEVSRKRDVER